MLTERCCPLCDAIIRYLVCRTHTCELSNISELGGGVST